MRVNRHSSVISGCGCRGGRLYVSFSFFITSPISFFFPLSLALPLSVRSHFDLNDWSSTHIITWRHTQTCGLPPPLSTLSITLPVVSQLLLTCSSLPCIPPSLSHTHTHILTHTTSHPSSLLAGLSSLQKLQGNKGIIDSILTETRRSSVGVCVCVCGVQGCHPCTPAVSS